MLYQLACIFALIFGTTACGSSGCCSSSRSQTPTVVRCGGGGCQQGYSCGPYGCVRRKALASITRRADGVLFEAPNREEASAPVFEEKSSLIEREALQNVSLKRLTDPSWIFATCCAARGLPEACVDRCSFQEYTADFIQQVFLRRDECPLEALNEMHYCAAQGMDHSSCCYQNGVGHTVAGRKCVQLCDQRPNRFYQLDPTYMPCFEAFPRIKRCFHEEIKIKAIKKYVVGALHNQLKSGMDDVETKKGRGFLNSGDNQSEKPRNFF